MLSRLSPRRSRPVLLAAAALAVVVLGGCAAAGPGADAAATVNGVTIAEDEFETMVRAQVDDPDGPVAGLEGEERTAQVAELQRQVLTQLIRVELLNQLAADRGVTVSDQEVEDRWQQEITFQGDEQALLDLIASLGLTEEQAREQLAASVKQQKLRDSLAEDVEVTDQEVRDLYESRSDQYEQADVSHILVDTEEEARAIVDLLEQGESFEELAQSRSTDTGSAQQGGNLGTAPKGQYVPEFDEAVWNATPGEIIGPIETQFGFHVIRVNEFVNKTFDDVEESLRDELLQGRIDDAFRELLTTSFDDADVEIDSRFGEWDPESASVIDPDAPAPPAPNQGGAPAPVPTEGGTP